METQSFLDLPGAQALASEIKAYIAQQQQQLLLSAFPIGTVIENTNGTNPGTYLGGSWVQYGAGRVTVGYDSSDTDFNAAGKTGGEKEVTLNTTQMPAHYHAGSQYYVNAFGMGTKTSVASGGGYGFGYNASYPTGSTGEGQAHNNMPPYIVVYRWRRTA